jgi:RNA polymerase sigma factor for flagellar operon FliA
MTATGQPVESPEHLFLEHLPVINRTLAIIARRNALPHSDAEEFAAWARGRLTEGDYAILRKFGGRSSLKTYLAVVLSNLFRDYRNSAWGRWRPSAAATRMGPLGVRLDELLWRDGCALREAIEVLRSAGADATDAELRAMAARLPQRVADKDVPLDQLGLNAAAVSPPAPFADGERERVEQTVRTAVQELPDEERLIVRMHFWNALSVAEIARILRVDQKRLYRRLEAIERRLRDSLGKRGITAGHVRELLSGDKSW